MPHYVYIPIIVIVLLVCCNLNVRHVRRRKKTIEAVKSELLAMSMIDIEDYLSRIKPEKKHHADWSRDGF